VGLAEGEITAISSHHSLNHLPTFKELTKMKNLITTTVVLSLLFAVEARGALIVDLLPAAARFDSLTDNDDGGNGFAAGNPSGAENAAGLTFNVTFTPAAGDLDSATAAVNLIEVGGDANGTGLYLLGGEIHFISKMDGQDTDVPAAFNDLNFASGNDMIGAKSSFGALSAGIEYSVAAVFDPITGATLDLGVLPTGGSVTTDSFSLTGVGGKTNWSGDDGATALKTVGSNGGGTNTVGGNAFSEALINGNPFEGTAGQGLYWSANANIIPEPSTLFLAALGMLGLLGCARRRKK